MTLLADLLSTVLDRRYRIPVPEIDDTRPLKDVIAELLGTAGEISGHVIARGILERFAKLTDEAKVEFFKHLADELSVSTQAVRTALDGLEGGQSKSTYRAFMAACEPPRQELIRRLNQTPGATNALVKMRSDLLRLGKTDDSLQAVDVDFQHLLSSWFNRGFLVLKPINWTSPAHVLEKIIAYEAVHAINSWDELRQRLEPSDRRCFAFFHPAMPDEPLIFVEVALSQGVPGSIQDLLKEDRRIISEDAANTAVFYSISNCQKGLAGISFGNSLIKQVASDLSLELPDLDAFVTLSPIPGLMRWIESDSPGTDVKNDEMMRALAARYLLNAKRPDGHPVDPVARFHLGNGATIEQLHAAADLSPKGLAQSGGVMVNYRYNLSDLSQNHELFATQGDVIASDEIRSLSKAASKNN